MILFSQNNKYLHAQMYIFYSYLNVFRGSSIEVERGNFSLL